MVKKRKYTREEFLQLKPVRKEFIWFEEEGKVRIVVPKFKSKIGKRFCRMLGRDPEFTVNLDEKGSLVWKMCDGKHTVEEILKEMEQAFPDEKDIDVRLFLFLSNMKKLGYVTY